MSRSFVLFLAVIASCASGSYETRDRSHTWPWLRNRSDYHEGKEQICRPCSFKDYDCMRKFLSVNSRCIPAPKFLPDPIYLPTEKVYLPVSSMTITHLDLVLRGFRNAYISEFYVNIANGNVVMEATLPKFNVSGSFFFAYQRKAKGTIALNDFATYEIDNLTLTAIIPKVPNLKLEFADIHADTHNAVPRAYLGPNLYNSNDPEVKLHFAEFNTNIVTAAKEAMVFHSYLIMTTFIQTWLCNFELDPYANYNGYKHGKCFSGTA